MKPKSIRTLFALGSALLPAAIFAGQAELDFNELNLGDTRTVGGSSNSGNLNTGQGFADAANSGEFDNNTGVLQFFPDDIGVPPGVANYVSTQNPDVNPGGTGVVISSSAGSSFRRMQDRHFVAPLTGGDIYFSFLTRIQGPGAELRLLFNTPATTSSTSTASAFAVGVGDESSPGALALLSETVGAFDFFGTTAIFWEDVDGDLSLDLVNEDLDMDGNLDIDEDGSILGGPPANGSLDTEDLNGNGILDAGEDTIVVNGLLDTEDADGDGNLDVDEDIDNDGNLDVFEDTDGNGILNGLNINDFAPHLIVGRIQMDNSGADDLIEIWLDPADATSLGTPTLSILSDELDPLVGVVSVGFEGLRRAVPSGDDGNGNFATGGRGDFDHFRISDNPDALDFVTGNALPDPSLDIAGDTPDANFVFGATYGTTLPVTSVQRTVKIVNNGATEDIVINSITLQNGNPDGVFTIISKPSDGTTLAAGASATITMEATSSAITGQTFAETLVIDTDEDTPANPQDRNVACSALFYPAGFKVNNNGSFDSNLIGWDDDDFNAPMDPAVRVTPGLNGTAGMMRIKGIGDVNGGLGDTDNRSQIVALGAQDWEFTFLFSPLDNAEFENYSGGSSAFSGDRSFQFIIQADQQVPQPATGTEGTWTDSTNADMAMINLSYQITSDDFAVFDGSGGGWTNLGIGGLTGSIDRQDPPVITADTDGDGMDDAWEDLYFGDGLTPADALELAVSAGFNDDDFDGVDDIDEFLNGTNPLVDDTDGDGLTDDADIPGDGRLDPANPNDTVNWYLVRIKGTGFGTPAASYTVSVSDPNTLNVAATSSAQTIFEGADIKTNTPGGYTYTSGDISTNSGALALCTPYWVDEACFWSGLARDPVIGLSATNLTIGNHNAAGGTGTVTLTNAGFSSPLTVSSIGFGGADFAVTDPVGSFDIPAGSSQIVTFAFTGGGVSTDTATISSNDPLTPDVTVTLTGVTTSDSQLLGNFDWETAGNDAAGDTDTFAVWAENGTSTAVQDVPGLIGGSTTAAGIAANGAQLFNTFGAQASDFQIDFPFVINAPGPSANRKFNMHLRTAGGGAEEINFRLSTGEVFECFNGAWTAVPNLDFSGAPLVEGQVYWLRIIGFGWGTAGASVSFEVFNTDGTTSLGASGDTTNLFRDVADAQANPMNQIRFFSNFGAPRFTVDDVVAKVIAPPASIEITGLGFNGGGGFDVEVSGLDPATTYELRRSTSGTVFTTVAGTSFSGGATNTFTDPAPTGPEALYQIWIP